MFKKLLILIVIISMSAPTTVTSRSVIHGPDSVFFVKNTRKIASITSLSIEDKIKEGLAKLTGAGWNIRTAMTPGMKVAINQNAGIGIKIKTVKLRSKTLFKVWVFQGDGARPSKLFKGRERAYMRFTINSDKLSKDSVGVRNDIDKRLHTFKSLLKKSLNTKRSASIIDYIIPSAHAGVDGVVPCVINMITATVLLTAVHYIMGGRKVKFTFVAIPIAIAFLYLFTEEMNLVGKCQL